MLLVDQDFLPQATSLISMAHRHIDIATFKAEITSKPRGRRLRYFFDILYAKRCSGVDVNFLINWNTERRVVPLTNQYVIQELKRRKVNVRILPNDRCCHAKLLIVDKRVAIIGSHNLSVRSCNNNFEVSYLIQDPGSVARLTAAFNHVFSAAKTPS